MLDSKPYSSLMSSSQSLSLHDCTPLEDGGQYNSIVGAFQYRTLTCPNIAFAINNAFQFMHCPIDTHWVAVKHILHYLKGATHYGLSLTYSPDYSLTCYTDADWASSLDDHCSTSGYYVFLNANLVAWSFSKQKVVSRSRMESEYCSLANGVVELVWIQSVL